MKVSRDKIVKFCEEYLKVNDFQDFCVNGLQIEGVEKVEKIVTGVTLSKKLIEAAIAKNAQMIIVHHGLRERQLGSPPRIIGYARVRLKLLLENNINLCGFHLPLDAHILIGNNISLANLFNLINIKPCNVGFIGDLKKEILFSDFVKKVNSTLNVKSFINDGGPKMVKRIAIISGDASSHLLDAYEMGADTYMTGEVRESLIRENEEIGINFINAGHYNTEKLGIQNLGKLIAKKFKVAVEFVDVPNDV